MTDGVKMTPLERAIARAVEAAAQHDWDRANKYATLVFAMGTRRAPARVPPSDEERRA